MFVKLGEGGSDQTLELRLPPRPRIDQVLSPDLVPAYDHYPIFSSSLVLTNPPTLSQISRFGILLFSLKLA
jgi:hypothetical protein